MITSLATCWRSGHTEHTQNPEGSSSCYVHSLIRSSITSASRGPRWDALDSFAPESAGRSAPGPAPGPRWPTLPCGTPDALTWGVVPAPASGTGWLALDDALVQRSPVARDESAAACGRRCRTAGTARGCAGDGGVAAAHRAVGAGRVQPLVQGSRSGKRSRQHAEQASALAGRQSQAAGKHKTTTVVRLSSARWPPVLAVSHRPGRIGIRSAALRGLASC